MFQKKIKTPLLILIVVQIVFISLAILNVIIRSYTCLDNHSVCNTFVCDANCIKDGSVWLDSSNATPGMCINTTSLYLGRGSYDISVNYKTDAGGNMIMASVPGSAPHILKFDTAELGMANETKTYQLSLDSSAEVVLSFEYAGGGTLQIENIFIQENTDMAKREMVYAVLVCAVLSLGYYIYQSPVSKRNIQFVLGMIIVVSSLPLLLDYMVIGHDLHFHCLRIEGIKAGLENGMFPVKIQPVWAKDYGYPTGVFYGDVLLYFPALLRMLGMTVQASYQWFVFAVNIATTLVSYFCFKKIVKKEQWALLGCMLYTLSLYRLMNIYSRASVGEYCAMIFLPVIFLGLYQIYTQDCKKFDWKLCVLPAIGLTGIIQTHVLTCEMVAVFIGITCLIFIKKTLNPKILISLFLTVALTFLLNAGFLVPFLDYYVTQDFLINSAEWGKDAATGLAGSVQMQGLYLFQIFSVFQNGFGNTLSTSYGANTEFGLSIGLPMIIGMGICAYYLFTLSKEERKHFDFWLIIFTFGAGALALFMCTYLFPWDAIASIHSVGKAIVSSLQFPWRYLSLASFFMALCICLVGKSISERTASTNASVGKIVIVVLSFATIVSSGWYFYNNYVVSEYAEPFRIYEENGLNSMDLKTCEYIPLGTNVGYLTENYYYASEGIVISSVQKEGTKVSCYVESGETAGFIEVPLLYYKGYAAEDCNSNNKLSVTKGNNNYVCVQIPEHFSGPVEISFQEPVYWRIAEVITVTTALFIALGCIKSKWSKKKV